MFGLGLGEWLVILFVALILFGPKMFGKLFGQMGGSVRHMGEEFKKGYQDGVRESESKDTQA